MRLWCEQKDGGAYGQSLDGGWVWLDASFELVRWKNKQMIHNLEKSCEFLITPAIL